MPRGLTRYSQRSSCTEKSLFGASSPDSKNAPNGRASKKSAVRLTAVLRRKSRPNKRAAPSPVLQRLEADLRCQHSYPGRAGDVHRPGRRQIAPKVLVDVRPEIAVVPGRLERGA